MGMAGLTMRIHAFLMPRLESSMSPVMVELFDRLREEGCEVTWSIGEHEAYRPEHLVADRDLYLLKSQAPAAMSIAAVLHAQGARILNPWPACAAAQDKVVAHHRLSAFGVPLPLTWVCGDPARLAPVLDPAPVVVKPHDGYHGTGVQMIDDPRDLAGAPAGDRPVVVQRRLSGPVDLKVYAIGDQVFGVRKAFDRDSHGRAGRPVELDPEVADVARRCGAAFGFGLYGVDIAETDDGPVVVDVNHFPGYKGVPDAAERLAAHVLAHVEGDLPPLPPLPVSVGVGAR